MSIHDEHKKMRIKNLVVLFEMQEEKLDLTNDGQRYKSLRTARAWTRFLARFYK